MEPIELFWQKYGALLQFVGFLLAIAGAVGGLWRAARDRSRDAEAAMAHIKASTETLKAHTDAVKGLADEIKRYMREATERDVQHQKEVLQLYKEFLSEVRGRRRRP